MAKIIVTSDQTAQGATPVFLEERIYPVHLSTDHAARQLIERLNWALNDAEAAEHVRPDQMAVRRARAKTLSASRARAA